MWTREHERECIKGLLSRAHTCHRAPTPLSLSLTRMLITYTQREQQQQEETQQTYKNKHKCRTTTNLTTRLATGTGRWEGGRESKTGRESLALLLPWPSSSTCCPLLDACSNKFQILTNKTMVLLFTSERAREQVRECVLWVLSGVWSELEWDSHAHYSHSE